ncbi:hypothetical protein S40285_09824 [Stachybotrys chlorohalonatus IBT 40285]|uniref:Uncharacterized protein n=1 Tax=Stachybotrys chlorohalonatus (strain IBT 40285) TaxID=1283841 RepID=A0A084QZ45_STAC4|nr:hypothetical protein S40285_09824 [Stachybotrys chlorohalonata IBT 40285]
MLAKDSSSPFKLDDYGDWLAFYQAIRAVAMAWGIWEYCDPRATADHYAAKPSVPPTIPLPGAATAAAALEDAGEARRLELAVRQWTARVDDAEHRYTRDIAAWHRRDQRMRALDEQLRRAAMPKFPWCVEHKRTPREKLATLEKHMLGGRGGLY